VTAQFNIKCLVPDLPGPGEVTPYLQEMHSNRWYTNFGPLNLRFEASMVDFFADSGSPGLEAQTFSSATTGLELILRAMNLPEGGRVLIPALTFPATALAILNAGLTPVLADVDPFSWELTAETAFAAHASEPLAAVMPVAAFGKPIQTAGWQNFQRTTGVPVLVDAAAALGQQQVPEDLTAVFSLHATKPFGVGEGGLAVSGDKGLLDRAKSLSNFGFQGTAGVVQQTGTNAKLGEYYAAVGLVQLKRWPEIADRRKAVAKHYLDRLAPLGNKIQLQAGIEDFTPAVFPVFVDGKAAAIHRAMTAAAIQTRHWYLPLLQKHPAFADIGIAGTDGNNTLCACSELENGLVGLPFHSFLSEDDIENICDILVRTL